MSKYKLIHKVPFGHRFFACEDKPGRIYIADASGATPDVTDDGPLYIDRAEPITQSGSFWRAKVLGHDDKKSFTILCPEEMVYLVTQHKLLLKIHDTLFHALA